MSQGCLVNRLLQYGVSQPQHYWHSGMGDHVHCRIFSIIPDLYPLAGSSAPSPQLRPSKLSPDITKYSLGAQLIWLRTTAMKGSKWHVWYGVEIMKKGSFWKETVVNWVCSNMLPKRMKKQSERDRDMRKFRELKGLALCVTWAGKGEATQYSDMLNT